MLKLYAVLLFTFLCVQTHSQVTTSQSSSNIIIEPGPGGKCVACDAPYFTMNSAPSNSIVYNANNTLTLNQSLQIAVNPVRLITGITAELTYFEFTPESEECMPCNNNSVTYGNFSSGTIASTPGVGTSTHNLAANFSPAKNPGSFPASFVITLPSLVKCCSGKVRWCIRYVISFDDCSVCSKVLCYTKNKGAVTTSDSGISQPSNQDQ